MQVSFTDYEVTARYDDVPWTGIKIYESATIDGPWTLIDTQAIDPVDPNPEQPSPKSFTTNNGTLEEGWYRVDFTDTIGNTLTTDPIFNAPASEYEILASLDDINGNLDGLVVEADAQNTKLIQVSVARVIKGYLARIIESTVLASWTSPQTTPDIIREAAAKLIAAQLYFNHISKSSGVIPNNHFSQRLYDEVINDDPDHPGLLNLIIMGDVPIPGIIVEPIESLSDLDYFPVDDTGRAFTTGMNL